MDFDLKAIFSRKVKSDNNEPDVPVAKSENLLADVSNWYADRYGKVLIQRNILFLLLIGSLFIVVFAVLQVSTIASQYTVRPFVIDVENKTGITNIVNPVANKDLLANEALTQYFVMKYVRSRESYCDTDFRYNYITVVRLLSAPAVYSSFYRYVNKDPKSPILIYGKTTCTTIKLRSIQFFKEYDKEQERTKNTAVIRFTVEAVSGPRAINEPKIASLEYSFQQMEMSIEDRDVNPLGFQVLMYRVDAEILKNE